VAGETKALWRGRPTMGCYDVLIARRVHDGEPRISMERLRVCGETSAHTSAQLMDREGCRVVDWSPAENAGEHRAADVRGDNLLR
jgi:hypothetical protein